MEDFKKNLEGLDVIVQQINECEQYVLFKQYGEYFEVDNTNDDFNTYDFEWNPKRVTYDELKDRVTDDPQNPLNRKIADGLGFMIDLKYFLDLERDYDKVKDEKEALEFERKLLLDLLKLPTVKKEDLIINRVQVEAPSLNITGLAASRNIFIKRVPDSPIITATSNVELGGEFLVYIHEGYFIKFTLGFICGHCVDSVKYEYNGVEYRFEVE